MEITITLNGGLVKIKPDGRILMSGSSGSRESVAIALIHSVVLACNDREFAIDRLFTIEDFDRHKLSADAKMVYCKWSKNGYLKRISEAETCFKHANNAKEALTRAGSFTCTVGVFNRIPKSRPSNRPLDNRDRTTARNPTVPDDNHAAPGAIV